MARIPVIFWPVPRVTVPVAQKRRPRGLSKLLKLLP
jgi:hypothetical protein